MDFRRYFKIATQNDPFPYQQRIVETETIPEFISVPTGAGKTAAVVLGWIWYRWYHPSLEVKEKTPRRLVYCLPMRSLAEQVRDNIQGFIANLNSKMDRPIDVDINLLMGGEVGDDWLLYPEKEQIIVGTQDMLLSRALNRGYGMSRFRWPWAFGMLNNDCLWVFDEVQLMSSGLPTSAQLAAFNRDFTAFKPCQYVWMSATLDKDWFNTVDYARHLDEASFLELGQRDKQNYYLNKRMTAPKQLKKLNVDAGKADSKSIKKLAQQVLELREEGSLTLIVVNRVERAQSIYEELQRSKKKTNDSYETLLIHSRFRPTERNAINQQVAALDEASNCIVVATQAIEAGLDISAATLFTDIAPWPSIIQRIGRCNRYGNLSRSYIYWIDLNDNYLAPYYYEDIAQARGILANLEEKNIAPEDLPEEKMRHEIRQVIRRKDMVELFDTTPDLSGADIDISRYIRDTNDVDVFFYWRDCGKDKRPTGAIAAPHKDELCAVNISQAKDFLSKVEKQEKRAYWWNYLDGKWQPVSQYRLRPGMTILLQPDSGGYSVEKGWVGDVKVTVEPVMTNTDTEKEDDTTSDNLTFYSKTWQTLAEHSDAAVREMEKLIQSMDGLNSINNLQQLMVLAARFHDSGKAHEVFQKTLRKSDHAVPPDDNKIWAKSPAPGLRHSQPYFRHELAGALSLIENQANIMESNKLSDDELNLLAYLVAAHHGKVRLSIRSLPGEKPPRDLSADTRITRGVWEGSKVYQADLGKGFVLPETTIDLELMELGGAVNNISWLERVILLRDNWGPFKLAYLEALLRVADVRSSM